MAQSYDNIQELIDEGTENRTVAATNMNQTSSRAHTIVSIFLEQKKKGKNIIFYDEKDFNNQNHNLQFFDV